MKKLLVALFTITLATSAFAEIIIQADLPILGGVMSTVYKPELGYDQAPVEFARYDDAGSFGAGVMWEFNSREEMKIHPFVGLSVGLSYWGFPLTGVGGLNIGLFNFGPFASELQTTLEAGPLVELWGSLDFFSQISVDMLFMPKSRRGLFGGIGITAQNIIDVDFDNKKLSKIETLTGLTGHIVTGWHF